MGFDLRDAIHASLMAQCDDEQDDKDRRNGVAPWCERFAATLGDPSTTASETSLREAVHAAIGALRREAGRSKTVFGGNDFAPVDYKVLTGSPTTLIKIADDLETALAALRGPT
jgi:hypothetical protein